MVDTLSTKKVLSRVIKQKGNDPLWSRLTRKRIDGSSLKIKLEKYLYIKEE